MHGAGNVPGKMNDKPQPKQTATKTMKTKNIIAITVLLGWIAGGLTPAPAAEKKHSQAQLEARAKVTKEDAQKTALAKVPGGKVKEAELEEENGKLIWSFDITIPDSKDITEVQVDANSGEVLAVEKETPGDEEKEADKKIGKAKEKKGGKNKKGEDDDDDDEQQEKN
jgi:uncharacterized membrane protein YkoI